MHRASPELRDLATDVIAHEAAADASAEAKAPAAFHVIDKLRPHLANLMGNGAVQALLRHALVLASAEISWLDAVQVPMNGSLGGLQELHQRVDLAEFLEGKVAVLSHVFALLVAFIGRNLTLRLIGDICPKFVPKQEA